jgi:putative spermidine/putrescine transport system permease protein
MSSSTDTVPSLSSAVGPASTGPIAHVARRRILNAAGAAVGVAPFIIFALMFLVLPSLYLMVQAFQAPDGSFTLQNIIDLGQPRVVNAFDTSLRLSAATAVLGALFGLLVAVAVIRGRLPGWLRGLMMTFSGVASNFAGVPLAFAFLAMLGRLGILTVLLKMIGLDIYRLKFDIVSFTGLVITYLYFQIPLMILIIAPAIDGLKKEWSEAAQTLGASRWQFWRYVGLPILWPNLLGTLSLLFANAFGAVATAYALAGSGTNIVPILLFSQIRGDVLHNPGVGASLALAMILITAIANVIYLVVRTRAERWLK